MNTTPNIKASGLLAPTRCFCNELNAIIATVTKATTEKPKKPVSASINRFKSNSVSEPDTADATMTTAAWPAKRIAAKKRVDFKYCLKMSLWFHPNESKYSNTPLFLS